MRLDDALTIRVLESINTIILLYCLYCTVVVLQALLLSVVLLYYCLPQL